jgi:hypothetical protein
VFLEGLDLPSRLVSAAGLFVQVTLAFYVGVLEVLSPGPDLAGTGFGHGLEI